MHILAVIAAFYGLHLASAQSSFSVYANANDIDPLPTNARCAEVLAADIQCPAVIVNALPSSSMPLPNFTATDLVNLCTPDCYESLLAVAAEVDAECSGWPFILGGTSYIASLPFRNFAYYWNKADVHNRPHDFQVLRPRAGPSFADRSVNSLIALGTALQPLLSPNAGAYYGQPLWMGRGIIADAVSGIFACNGKPIVPVGILPLYTVQANDKCIEITVTKGITWSQLLKWNPYSYSNRQINTYCDNLDSQVGKAIFLLVAFIPQYLQWRQLQEFGVDTYPGSPTAIATPTAPVSPGADRVHCGQWYVAVPGDSCPQILQIFQMTNETFYELNPLVNEDCSNLIAGFSYCVDVFGDLTQTLDPFTTPTATGATLIQYITGDFPVGTGYLAAPFNVTGLEPILPPSTTFTQSPTPTPTIAPGTISDDNCLQYYEIQTGDTCLAIEIVNEISDDEFHLWNPEIDSNCANLIVGLSYCVFGPAIITSISVPIPTTPFSIPPDTSTESPTSTSAAGTVPTNVAIGTITSGCLLYYTIQPNDNCDVINTKFSITLSQFINWNPEVNSICSNIILEEAYCVSGPAISSTPVPSPTAPGTITTGCAEYYTVVPVYNFSSAGDFCGKIEDQFGISLLQFLTWNPEVDSEYIKLRAGDNIQAGLQYCVSGPTSTVTSVPPSPTSSTAPGTITTGCTHYYTVISGDFCAKIESQFSISMAQFLKWNTGVNAQCSNLSIGLQVPKRWGCELSKFLKRLCNSVLEIRSLSGIFELRPMVEGHHALPAGEEDELR
ncbi:hypothetical protein C8J57DRAFT_1462365, partial [Mycena rebaudengoi]